MTKYGKWKLALNIEINKTRIKGIVNIYTMYKSIYNMKKKLIEL